MDYSKNLLKINKSEDVFENNEKGLSFVLERKKNNNIYGFESIIGEGSSKGIASFIKGTFLLSMILIVCCMTTQIKTNDSKLNTL